MFGFSRRASESSAEAPSKWSAFFLVFSSVFVASSATIIVIYDKPKDTWPHLLGYIVTNPLVLGIGAAVLGFLTIERFKDISTRVSEVAKQVYEINSSLEKNIRSASEGLSKDLSAEWGRVQNKLDALKRENPWIESISKLEITVNVPTTGAALRNIEQFLKSDDSHIAYEILFETATRNSYAAGGELRRIDGTPAEFETLAFIALALFSDAYLCDRLLARAEGAAGRFSAPWKARRVIFALLNGQQGTAESLSLEMESQLRPGFWAKVASKLGRKVARLPLVDFYECIAAIQIFDTYIQNEDAHRRKSWLEDEERGLPPWGKQLVLQTGRMLSDDFRDNKEFVALANAQPVRTSVALLRSQQLMVGGRTKDLATYMQHISKYRSGLSVLERVPSATTMKDSLASKTSQLPSKSIRKDSRGFNKNTNLAKDRDAAVRDASPQISQALDQQGPILDKEK